MNQITETKKSKPTISAIIIAKNEERMIANCLNTLRWCDEVILVDNDCTDNTVKLAEQEGARIVKHSGGTFASARNAGRLAARGDWQLYVDADERVTPALKRGIESAVQNESPVAYAIPRRNIHYGAWMRHGGWEKDFVVRLFSSLHLRGWEGEVHERAEVDGDIGELQDAFIHFTHRSVQDGLRKTIHWTAIEARLLYEAGHKKIGMRRLLSIPVREYLKRTWKHKAGKDGEAGKVEAMIQAMNRFLVYVQLWELQQNPPIEDLYAQYEQDIAHVWKKS